MIYLLKQIFGLIKLLNSDTGANQISLGVALGLILGFSPLFSLQSIVVFVILFFFRVQIGSALLSAFFFAFIAFLLDPVCHFIGSAVLETESLRPLFTALYNMPIVPFTRFYNSIVMGSGILALLLAPFVYFGSNVLIAKYRATILARFEQTPTAPARRVRPHDDVSSRHPRAVPYARQPTQQSRLLYEHSTRAEFTVRHNGHAGDIAFWDNRCTQHRVDNDSVTLAAAVTASPSTATHRGNQKHFVAHLITPTNRLKVEGVAASTVMKVRWPTMSCDRDGGSRAQ